MVCDSLLIVGKPFYVRCIATDTVRTSLTPSPDSAGEFQVCVPGWKPGNAMACVQIQRSGSMTWAQRKFQLTISP